MKRNRCGVCIIGLVLLALAVPGKLKSAAADSQTSSNRSMVLTVVDGTSGKPLPGVWPRTSIFTATPKTDDAGKSVVTLPSNLMMSRFAITFEPSAQTHVAREAIWWSTQGSVLEKLPAQLTIKLSRSLTIGGFVKDSSGLGIAGCRIVSGADPSSLPTLRTNFTFTQHDIIRRNGQNPPVTDAKGFWTEPGHSPETERLWISVQRPDGGVVQFATTSAMSAESAGVIEMSMSALLATNAALVLPDGATWGGIVVDDKQRPLPGVVLSEEPLQRTIIAPTWTWTNNADGRFELAHRIIPYGRLTGEAPGRAIASLAFHPGQEQHELRLVLQPANPVRVQLLGPDNKPAVGVQLSTHESRMRHHLVQWRGSTDNEGRVVWSNAPLETVVFRAYPASPTLGYSQRVIRIDPEKRDVVVRLDRNPPEMRSTIKVRALDASNASPISSFEVLRAESWSGNFQRLGKADPNGLYVSPSNMLIGASGGARLKVQADGYRAEVLSGIYAEDGDREFTVRLKPLKALRGIVAQPDGRIATNATVFVNQGDELQVIDDINTRSVRLRENVERFGTGADGSFELPRADEPHHLFISHPSGFANLHVSDWPSSNRLVLQPWAHLEGSLRNAGDASANETLVLRQPLDLRQAEHFTFYRQASTRQSGRFLFTNLVPGEYLLYRPQRYFSGLVNEEYYRMPVLLRAGETNHIQYSFGGRRVVGQLFASQPVDWKYDRYTLRLKLPPPSPSWNPPIVDLAEHRAFQRELANRSPSLAHERKRQQFQLVLDATGAFRVDDVPPGDYELEGGVSISSPNAASNNTRPFRSSTSPALGMLLAKVNVPDGPVGTELDIGTFEITLTNSAAISATAPLAMSCITLDGKPFDVSSTRGRPTLLLFWAAWAPDSSAHLTEFVRLAAQLELTGAAMVSVNLDEQPAIAERGLNGLSLGRWTHVRLVGKARTDVTELLQLDTLPAVVVLNRDGVLVSRNMTPARVPATLQRLAQRN